MIKNKKGNQMVEAAIVMPIIILTVVLLLRIFTFYLEILSTGIREHEKALAEWNNYSGSSLKVYENVEKVVFLKGGILETNLSKRVETKAYFCNRDNIVRGKYFLSK